MSVTETLTTKNELQQPRQSWLQVRSWCPHCFGNDSESFGLNLNLPPVMNFAPMLHAAITSCIKPWSKLELPDIGTGGPLMVQSRLEAGCGSHERSCKNANQQWPPVT